VNGKYGIGIALVIAVALVAGLVIVGGPASVVVRSLLVAPFVLLVPGYACVCAIFGVALGFAERLALSIGLSLALGGLVGLALHLTPPGVRPLPWLLVLIVVTLVAAAIAQRRGALPVPSRRVGAALPLPQALLLGAAALITCAALGVAVVGAQRAPMIGFTQLWLLPSATQGTGSVNIGVENHENRTLHTTLVLTRGGQEIQRWPDLALADGATWQTTIALPTTGNNGAVEATLYQNDDPTAIYRRVQLSPDGR
jgi:uncharacterized membrane protein